MFYIQYFSVTIRSLKKEVLSLKQREGISVAEY